MSMEETSAATVRTLKKKRGRLLIAGTVAAAAGLAIAASAGKYYCAECTFDQGTAFGETENFIRSDVNQHINSWVDSKGNPLDVTICNGSECATYLYTKLTSVFLLKKKEKSSWRGDNEIGSGGGAGDSPGGGGTGSGGGSGPIGSGCQIKCTGIITVGA
ncbi:hypothetical protein [Stenotrophomonas bentonitica]|uniref:Uncharacterized protein n=1 Tax=Stenotrophomonas bentonitica TaxID=1450134 RepID=A0ABU9JI87_9GAMM